MTRARRSLGRLALLLLGSTAVAVSAGVGPAAASDITYTVDQTIGAGSVVGQIVTDGKTGILSTSDIVSWNFALSAPGATYTLTSVGNQSTVGVSGADLTATTQGLYFNFSGTDGGHMGFQQTGQASSGLHYICYNTNWFGCSAGASVVPGANTDPSAQYDTTWIGLRLLGTSGPLISNTELLQSIQALVQARTGQILVSQLLSQLLVGLDEQISCGNCGGAGATFGSAALSGHGRYALSPEWTLLGGADLGEYGQKGARVNLNVGFATALQYDPAGFGASRPFAVVGLSAAYQNVRYQRSYTDSTGAGIGAGSTRAYDINADVQVGWVDRLTRRDEAAAYVSYSRAWQITGGYAEQGGDANPFGAVIPGEGPDFSSHLIF